LLDGLAEVCYEQEYCKAGVIVFSWRKTHQENIISLEILLYLLNVS
jgi:hypothetical protein